MWNLIVFLRGFAEGSTIKEFMVKHSGGFVFPLFMNSNNSHNPFFLYFGKRGFLLKDIIFSLFSYYIYNNNLSKKILNDEYI